MTFSNTLTERKTTRQAILDSEDKTVLQPFDYNLLTPIIRPIYAELWQEILANKTPATIQVEYSKDNHDEFVAFLRGWILANGYNRESLEKHVTEIIGYMRSGFSPSSTNFAVDLEGAVRNGGHSGKALLRGFFPESDYYGLQVKPYMKNGKHIQWADFEGDKDSGYFIEKNGLTYESILPSMPTSSDENGELLFPPVGEYDENGQFIMGSDTPETRLEVIDLKTGKVRPIQLIVNVSVYGPNDALHRENTTLVPTVDTYLSMNGHIKTHMESLPDWLKPKVGNLLTMIRKRTLHSSTGYGYLGRGGRMNGEDGPSWYLAYMPQVLDSLELLKDSNGVQKPRPLFTANSEDGTKGGANLLQILVAMSVSDQTGRERIAKLVSSPSSTYDTNKAIQKMVDVIRPPKSANGVAPTDMVVELLVLWGLGKKDPVDHYKQAGKWVKPDANGKQVESSPWLFAENRASGWDSSDVDSFADGDDILSSSLVEYAKILSGEASRAVASASRKAKPKAKK